MPWNTALGQGRARPNEQYRPGVVVLPCNICGREKLWMLVDLKLLSYKSQQGNSSMDDDGFSAAANSSSLSNSFGITPSTRPGTPVTDPLTDPREDDGDDSDGNLLDDPPPTRKRRRIRSVPLSESECDNDQASSSNNKVKCWIDALHHSWCWFNTWDDKLSAGAVSNLLMFSKISNRSVCSARSANCTYCSFSDTHKQNRLQFTRTCFFYNTSS